MSGRDRCCVFRFSSRLVDRHLRPPEELDCFFGPTPLLLRFNEALKTTAYFTVGEVGPLPSAGPWTLFRGDESSFAGFPMHRFAVSAGSNLGSREPLDVFPRVHHTELSISLNSLGEPHQVS